jgi:hypothetical protein
MPRRLAVSPAFQRLLDGQDQLVERQQALDAGFSRRAIDHRIGSGQWQLVLPDVYLTHRDVVTRRHQLRAGLLYGGVAVAALDSFTACHDMYGMDALARDEHVFVAVPGDSPRRSRDFLVVRRCTRMPAVFEKRSLRVVSIATAAVAACRRLHDDREVLAAFSELVQRRRIALEQLVLAHVAGPPRNAGSADRAIEQLAAGVRSAPEGDFRRLAQASPTLPPLVYNCLLRLPCGRLVSPDALAVDSGVIHETNGRRHHAREDLFEDMQERHDAMTAAGLVVLHNSPRRIALQPRLCLAEFERCHVRHVGRGLPMGVEIVRAAA